VNWQNIIKNYLNKKYYGVNFKIMSKNLKNGTYQSLLEELKGIISNGKYQAYKAVDNIKVQTYWQLGERIFKEELNNKNRADYEQYLVNNLAIDLSVSKRFVYQIIKFYKVYSIVQTLSAQLSWSHYVELIELSGPKERQFYEQKIIYTSWSIRELRKHIKNKLYQNTDQKEVAGLQRITGSAVTDLQKLFKPEYNLNFLNISENHQEKELEDKIVNNIVNFLKELGGEFSFLDRQVPILIDGQKHFIDLVLFHRGIPCIVLVDLKAKKLDSRDIGQMNKYLGYFRNNRQYIHEQDAIGLIICSEAGCEEVIYALDGLEDKIFVAKYKTKLPSEAKIKRIIKKL
jgi:predicted nuclease of restriction endonuclease-like (RecB) superfamily